MGPCVGTTRRRLLSVSKPRKRIQDLGIARRLAAIPLPPTVSDVPEPTCSHKAPAAPTLPGSTVDHSTVSLGLVSALVCVGCLLKGFYNHLKNVSRGTLISSKQNTRDTSKQM